MASTKPEFSQEYTEFEPRDDESQTRMKTQKLARTVESIRLAVTVLAFLIGITILSTSADTLVVYKQTHLDSNYLLPLWPENFNIRPTVSLVIGGSLLVFANGVTLLASKISAVRYNPVSHMAVSCLAPFVGGAAVVISTAFFYIVNDSTVVDSLQSWSCRWESLGMNSKPNWGMLCSESKAALYLTIIMIPVEILALAITLWGISLEKKAIQVIQRKGSPALS